jgi:hypothetical protein
MRSAPEPPGSTTESALHVWHFGLRGSAAAVASTADADAPSISVTGRETAGAGSNALARPGW